MGKARPQTSDATSSSLRRVSVTVHSRGPVDNICEATSDVRRVSPARCPDRRFYLFATRSRCYPLVRDYTSQGARMDGETCHDDLSLGARNECRRSRAADVRALPMHSIW
eukprot:7930315-Heterocapsa_arctica.AAC.1